MKEDFNLNEKSVSQQQQKLMGLAYAYKKGEVSGNEVSDEVKKIADTMSMKDLKDFAGTKHKGLPVKKEEFDEINEEEETTEEMLIRKLYFIEYAAEEIIDSIRFGFKPEEWFQYKIAAAHEKIKGLHSYVEGDKRLKQLVYGEE